MTRKITAFVVLMLLLGSACGSGDDGERASSVSSPSPGAATGPTGATDEPGDGTTTEPGATSAGPGATQAPGRGGSSTAASGGEQPVKPAKPGGINRPAEGVYRYDLEGSQTSPFCPTGCPFDEDAEVQVEVDANGDTYTVSSTGEGQGSGRSTNTLRWQDDQVLLLRTENATQVGTFGCTFNPPVKTADIPIQARSWTVDWKGDDCEGRTTVNVVAQEEIADATGRKWSTWKIEQRTEYRFQDVSGVLEGPAWFSPDLGLQVKADQRNDGSFTTQTGQKQNFSAHTITTLKKRP